MAGTIELLNRWSSLVIKTYTISSIPNPLYFMSFFLDLYYVKWEVLIELCECILKDCDIEVPHWYSCLFWCKVHNQTSTLAIGERNVNVGVKRSITITNTWGLLKKRLVRRGTKTVCVLLVLYLHASLFTWGFQKH